MTPANAQPTALPTAIDEQLATEREYWLAKLAGELPLSTFPADAPRALLAAPASAASAASTPAEVPLALAPRAAARLVAICGGRDPLLLASLVALVEILLHKVTGHEEIVVGTTIHRRHAELAAFNRLLALRGRIVPEMALKDALQAAKETLAEAFAHQKFPFARLLELLAVEQQQRPALFAVLVLLDSVNDPEHAREAAADARFVFHRDGDGFVGTLEYDARLYRRETLEVMAKHFRTLLDRLLAAPGGTVGELDLLDDADRQQVLYDGNATAAPYPRESTIHALFLEQAARTPRAEALVLGERSMSYGELARRAGQIARFLAGEGIGAGDRVAIFLEHSFAVVEAVLGVLMAGAAYVPLDPEHPKGRLDFLLADSGACLALTSAALAGKLPEGTRTVRLDADREAIERAIDWAMTEPLANDPEAVAYVLYTSGSTGRPKGVKVRHRSLVNYVWWAREVYLQGEPLSFALYTSLAFDLTVTSLFTPLVSGSRLYLYPRREREVPLLDILADDRTEVLKLTPSHLELIKERDNRGSRVRRLIVGGEALSAALARQIAESFGGRVEIDNEYGPTEATVGCMLHRFGPDDDRRAFVPIGRPAANVRLYVLDGALRPVADGLPGELYVGGLCLAEGYLNRDELTAERFLADPFVPGERVYRTGDLARRLPGGILDFLGRSDEQVKIRGHRIELGEIRVALSRHPGVRDSVVRVAEEGEGRELVAYYVARTEIAPEEIRSALAVSLPEEAIPAFFVHLKRLPLTLNGKVNLQALPTLAEIRQRSRPGYVAPRDAAETAMAEIWSVLLGVPQVGAHDNFFQLGGDSIATVRVAARANQAGFQLAPRQIFEFQTLAELTAAIGGLAAPATPGSAIPAIPAIPRRSGSGPAPLSFAQERLWFLDRLVPGSPLYNVPLPLMLYGALDSAALAASLRGLAVRHEPLRTTFAESEAAGGPVQIVAAKPPLPFLPVVDLGSLPADRVETVALGLAREEALRPFDLGRGPLLRATLLRLAEPRHLLLLTLHHIVADGWSMGILVRELGELYGAAAAGRPAVLPELPISYADFAVWQREWLAGGALAEPLAWWREHLAGAPAVLDLPLDRPRPPVPSFRGAHLPVRLPADLSRALAVYGRTRGATPFMVLSAAFAALLSRLSGAEDLVVGSPVANRERPEVSGLIGFFVNTLALRHDLSGDPAFAGFLDRVRTGTMAALAHQDVPFERLVEELAPERDLRHTPLFQVFFALQNAPVGPLALPGLALEPLLLSNGRAKFDLSLALAEAVDGLAGSFEYATDLFDAATVERLAARFERLLAGALERPETRLSELPLLSAEEREQLVVDWAARVSDYPREATLDGLFAEVAAHRPDAVALVDGERQLSYGALAARAGHLAGRLRALGVAPEVRVGLLLPRSLEMVVATLAVLRAGGVYVPLDPTHPEERLAFLLSDTGAPVVVTIASLRATLPALETAVLCLDREAGREPGSAAFASRTVAESLAYVMYTSGSTGVPKGVAVRHRGVVRLVRDSDYARLGREDVVALVSNTAFDAATFEIWGALLNGGRLVVIEPAAVLPPAVFAARLAREGVTLLSLTIALFNRMVWEAPEALRNLRSLYFGGEAADAEAVARLVALGPPERLIHLYGPTEITCFATWYRVPGVPGAPGAPALPIGRPLANTAVYLLGRHLEPVAAGAPGEIWLGGDGLARGYLDRPDRTAERFVPAPFGAAGERLYRTGDRARFRPNGEIEFLGRLDAQVKIRGFRIEPGEVEAALLRQSGVTAAVVVVREEGGEKRLAAYYVGAPEPAELRAALRRALPEYLVPAALVPLPELLLNPNGKIDRRALPVPPELGEGTAGEAPRTAVEARLAAIWCELLGRTRVGRSEDFFALGGHSLLATRLLSRLQTAFGVELPLLQLFESPTLSEQAARVAAAVAGSVAPIPRSGRRKDLPLSFAQERLWFLDRLEPGAPTYNVATAVRLQGALDRPALDRSLGEIVRRHEVLRTTFGLVAGRPAQRVGPATGFALPRVDLASLASETREGEARRLTAEEAARPFDLARGPLLRGILVGLAPGEHLALLTFHHIVFDGWSGEVVVRELGALYPANIGGGGGAGGGQPSPLPELPIQYADFALWQRAQLAGERLAGELAYWREALAGLPALALTTDRVRPPVRNSRSAIHLVRWPEAFVRAAAGLAQARGATLFMALLAGFVALLHRYTGQEDFALGSPIANRTRPELFDLIGFFVNTLVLRGDITGDAGDPAFTDLLARLRQTALSAYAHQDLPFERLVEELAPERSLGQAPLFQVMFALMNRGAEPLALPGLTLEAVPVETGRAKFDLMVTLAETAAGVSASWEHDVDLFDRATIERMATAYERLLAAAVERSAARLSELPLLSDEERRQLLVQWSVPAVSAASVAPYPLGRTIHSLFLEQAARTPQAEALVLGEASMTYGELARRAGQVARFLAGEGIGAGDRVAIFLEHSFAMVEAVLGALLSGAAYVPLDPEHPKGRLELLLADSGARLALTTAALVDRLPEGTRSVRLDADRETIERAAAALPETDPQGSQAVAYVLYTSGSTGRPKGVKVRHRSLVNYISWAREVYLQGEPLSFALYTSLAFDLTVTSLFTPLLSGSRLFLYPRREGEYPLLDILADDRAEVLKLTPSHLELIKERDNRGSRVRRLIVGGEALSAALARQIEKSFDDQVEIYNEYGPTEATVGCMLHRFSPDDRRRAFVPIGGPAANVRLYVLDGALQPVAEGLPGELYVGGLCLAEGYLGLDTLTAERFLADPFVPGERVYRTGDRVRRLPGDLLDFLGRSDEQVKIRGHRIELGEIRVALNRHAGVRDSVVRVAEEGEGRELVAYYVSRTEIAPEELKSFLAESLLGESIPAFFVHLKRLPLTLNGKVNLQALPTLAEIRQRSRPGYVAPRDAAETAMAEIWSALLGVPQVGVHDNFFQLGGDSIATVRVAARANQAGFHLAPRQIFQFQTLAELTAAIGGLVAQGSVIPSIPRRTGGGPAPLSFAQERLWFLDRLVPGSPLYNVPLPLTLRGALDPAALSALAASLRGLAVRHEPLRTTFVDSEAAGRPVQIVATEPPLPFLPVVDLGRLPADRVETAALGLAREEALRPFDLGRGPLLRATLLRLAEPRHLLLLTLHHIVADGWSMGILVRELGELYGAAASGRPAVLPELPVAYADFAVWQREWLAGGALDEPLAWWRERLAGAPAVLDLPLDRPRPAAPAFRGAHLPFRLPAELSRALSSFGRARGATPFIVLLSIFSALLSRLSGEEDLVVGSPVANRERPEVSGLIGFFVNTLALRADLSGDPTFGAFLERVRVGTMEALAHQDVPFERLVEELAPERDLRHTPLFQVMLALQSAPVEPLTLPGLALEPLLFASDSAKFDLTLALTETAEGLSGGFEYATDLFDRVTVERLAAAYGRLLGAAVERPESRLSELPLLSGAERHQALVEWNDTASGYPRQSLHRLFEEQAAARPEAVAVVGEEGQLTYGELDRQAARIARRLRRLGVRGEARVGLCLERSAEMVAAVLGILKAGGAYLPLDPFQPRERQALLLSDAAPAAIVGARPLLAMLPGTALRLAVEDLVEGDGAEAAFDPAADREETGPEGLAYVLYTSGSTGVPKGVEVHHAAVARLVCDTGYAAFGPDEVFLQLAPMSFDAATLELWGPLLHGGRLVLFPPGPVSPAAVGAAVARHGVTTLWLTAGLFHLAVEEGLAGLGGLRQLLAGGDVLSPSHVERALAALPGVAVINGYGPTENTTFSCTHRLPGGWSGGTVPIGRPIANSPAYLLDRAMEPVPAGATGEIYVGGAGLARGYLRLPDRTGERFVPDPFATGEGGGARLYRTGDLARRLPDGTLRFLGRRDFQVKVRGFRVELGEVEAVVAACPGVEAVVVTAHPDPGGDRRLVAYVVARDAAVTPGELRQALQVRLPEAMIPARFVFLGALPLGANGKVDRRALPAPEENGEGEKGEAPRTALEARLAAIWRQLLGRAQLSRHDDFFALGGHSLLATRLLSRLRTDFAVELPLRQLFEQPTLAAQAALVAAARAAATAAIPPIPAIPGGDRAGFLPLSFAQERLWFLDRLEPGAATYNVATAVRLHGPLDRRALAASLGEIVRRHEVLRTTFALAAGRPAQRIGPAVGFALLLADLSGLAEERREGETGRLAAAESARPFDLERGPLLRGLLVGLAPRRHEALFTFHHIVFDGWSVEVLVRELGALYPANIGGGGRPSPLPELPIQYADFAVWQRAQLQGERLAGELDYWREALAGLPALVLPTDRSRPPVRTSRSAIHPMRCPAALARAAAEMAQANGATLFMVLLASFVALLHRYSAQEDFAVGSPIANRTQREVEDLIGFFVNTLVLRSNIAGDAAGEAAGDPAFCDLLARMRQTALSAYAHQDLPFERLVEELAPERSLGQAPLFQVMFALTNRGTEPLTLPGLTLEAVPVETGRAKFDLMVTLADTAEGVTGSWEYDVDLFDRASVERMATAYERLLAAAVERPAARLSELPLLSDEERRQLINLWSVPAAPGKLYPLDRTIHALFLEQAARTPRAEALVLGEASRTYGDLALRAGRIARFLAGEGIGAGDRVAIFLEHSFAMVEAVLGVLISGAAYVPLDPEHPKGRLEFILADSGVRLALTTAALSDRLPEGTRIVRLDAQEEEIERATAELPAVDLQGAEAVAYVLYTSGSTGQPKGVKVRHRSLVNYVCWAREVYLQGEPLSFALYTSLAFDLTVTSLFTPLVSGGRLYLYPRREGEYPLLDILADDRAEVLKLTPSHLELIRERDNRGSRVRRLIVGGEALSAALAGQVEASFGGRVEIDNEYGPTEATVGCMLHRFGRDDHRRAFVPIGGPAAHVRLYVLDGALQPVAEGLPGELYVGGVCLAEGYLNRDDLTAERFLADPFVAGERVYRTGDRVRRLPGGLLDFLGRADEQVKIRGHRIELGEVRVALNRHRGVRDSVVQVAEGGQGRELVAYYVARTEIDPEELKSSLAESLPEAAIPAFFVHLKRLPLTLNGKVNLQALPTLAEIRRRSRPGFVAPRDAAEVAMAEIWSALLGVALVGAHDNFFQLGGDSIATVRVAARANQAGFQLAPRQIFQFQTLAELTAAIGGIAGIAGIPRRATSGPVPLSFAQERLWFLDQLSPGSPLYNVPLPLRLRGALDAAALAASLQALVGRHEALRTAFTVLEKAEGEPVQVVAPAADRPLPRVDLTGLPADRREPVALGLVREEALRPFDLARGPVLRATLVRLAEADHLLLLTLHHIVADGWSMGVLVREMGELYGAAVAGRPAVMPELPIQYADFALWQREWLAGGALAEQLAWWRERLAGAPAVLDLPIDRPRPPVGSFRGGHLPVHLPAALSRALSTFGRARGATPFMALLAVFSALLSRLSGAADLVVGSPVANRERPEVSGLIGFFVNTLALRGDLSGDPTFGDLLARVRAAAMEALAHQDVPFERLVEELAPERDLRHTPLFQVMLALQNAPVEALELPGLALEPLALESGLAKFDLTVAFAETAAGLAGSFEYATDLFDAVTVERLAERFERLLAGSLERPEARLSELPLLSASEQRQLLATGGAVAGVSSPYPLERTIHDLFREQAERTPEAAALVLGAASLTYRELARRAFRIARFLAGEGIGAGDRVALFLDHSFEMVEAVLGVLLSGAAYVPLDPEHPRGRLDFLLADSGARLAFTSETLAGRLSAGAARIVRLDADRERIERANAGDVELPASDPRGSEAVAYVLYTSGSTGQPKGVKVRHRSLVNYISWAAEIYLQGEPAAFALYTSLAFDLTVTSLFTPLVTGNRLLIYPRREGEYPLLDILADDRAEVLKLTPSHLKLIQERDNRGSRVRRLIVGGEALSAALARQVEASFGDRVEIYNEYGPTEATVGCMLHRFGADDRRRAFVPIGRPAANVRLYVLDSALQPVAEGLPGELYVGGFCLAEGYLNRDDLTAERFLADPYVSGERVYRTGDRVRRLPGGLLDFLGRADEQVKIRGHRIELGEIRVALNRHPRVRDSVVLVAEEAQGPQLVAFYVARAELDPQALQSALAETLPEAAIPSSFVHLKRMPLTLNGKVNVQALPKLAEIRQGRRAGYVAPRDAAEAAMAAIWSSLLGVALVGAHDNFFQLGGDSIATVRVAARATQAGFRLAPRQIFQFQTLAELTAAIGGLVSAGTGGEGAGAAAPAIPRRAGTGPAPLSFAQERLWFLDQLSPGSPLYNVPLALRLRGALDAGALAASLEALVGRHEALRTRFAVLAEGSPVQWVAPALERVLPQVDLTGLPEDRRETAALGLARQEALRPFDLARGPLLRSTLVRLAESHHLLLLTLHHIVADGWSMGVLVRDMGELYGAVAARRPAVLPELPVQYADFAVWQREWLAAGALAEQLAWWRERLAGAPAELELPVDRPRPAVPSFRGAYLPLQLPAALSRDLSTFGRGRSATPFMVLLAAFTALLSRLAGVADLVVGTPVANRERPEISGLIGFFVNTLPLRGDLSGDPAFGALLARVQAGAMAALAHPDVPFERLVEELAPDRDLRRAQLFQVMLALQNAPVDPLELPGLALEPLALAGETAKFDLTLALGETATGFSGSFEYATDLFDTVTVERLAARFERLLAGALAEPEARLSELPLLSAEERSQLVGAWAVQVSAYPRDATLDGRFAEVAAERADAVALVEGDQQLSYGELAARANLLACRLRELGVAPEVRVGLLLPRSLALVVATLAVLQAGGVYVPLDPSHPAERLAFLLRDTAAPVVVTLTPLLDRLPAISATSGGDAATVLCLDAAAASGPGRAAPASLTAAENLAYVMYTSGSTGVPKGVAVPHRGVVRLVSHTDFVQIGPEDVVSQVANPAFDAVTFEIWGALLNGGRLVVIEPEVVLSPADFAARLAGQSVSVVCLTTALLHQMAREAPGAFRGLRHLLFGGEAGDPAAIARLLAAGPPDRLIHGYGPTESTTLASWYLANRMLNGGSNAAAGPPVLPIGRAAANTAVYVLGAHLEPVAAGVPGEICIGGDGLARGYLHRPELTAERFVPAPFGETGGRLYRTGDRARWRLDGEIEFLGRLDAQVKIRGFRIEPGEVEAALLQVDGVAAAVVVVREARGEKLLVAYYTGGPQPAELRVALRAALPEYLMPSAFVPLAALPLTPNGKVDRRALPAVELSRLAGREFVAPRTPLEEQVAEVWKTVLGVERVGVYDSFWELGGHSLLGTRVLARLRNRFGIDLPLRMLFTTPILGELAAAVGQEVLAAQGDEAGALVAELDGLSDDEIRALLEAEEQALEERR